MKKIIFCILTIALSCNILYAQLREKDQLLGPTIGLWTSPSEPTFGFNYEAQLSQVGDAALISLGGIFRYAKFRDSYPPSSSFNEYTYTTFGLQSNLNFNRISDGKFVPFIGMVIGYNSVSASHINRNVTVSSTNYTSGAWIWGQAGMRYFFNPSVAGVLRIGAGNFNFNSIELGVDFKP